MAHEAHSEARRIAIAREVPDTYPTCCLTCIRREPNEEIIETLTSIHGISQWTAEMFLIFSLNRLDVLPVDDLGIKKAVQQAYGVRSLPTARKIGAIDKPWHPYETITCWNLWRSLRLNSSDSSSPSHS